MATTTTPPSVTVVQYGFRDDDDDSVCEPSLTSKILGAPTRQLKKLGKHNPKKKIGRVLNEASILLKGASLHSAYGSGLGLYGLKDDDDDDDSSSSYESESSSDDGNSVCSNKSSRSVASKASQTLKMLGSSFRGAISSTTTTTKRSKDDNGLDDDSSLHMGSSLRLEAGEEGVQEDASVSSLASKTVKRVKGRLSKALSVTRGRRSSSKKEGDNEEDYSSSSDEEEEDLLEETSSFKEKPRMLPRRTKSFDGGEDKKKGGGRYKLRRSNTSEFPEMPLPSEVQPMMTGRRQNQRCRRNSVTKFTLDNVNDLGNDDNDDSSHDEEEDQDLSDLSSASDDPEEEEDPEMHLLSMTDWSMNVTPEMLKQAQAKGWNNPAPPNKLLLQVGNLNQQQAAPRLA